VEADLCVEMVPVVEIEYSFCLFYDKRRLKRICFQITHNHPGNRVHNINIHFLRS